MCDSSNEKEDEKLFLPAIRRCLCSCSADWLKIDSREKPVSMHTLETGRYATVRFAAPLTCTSSLSYPSSEC